MLKRSPAVEIGHGWIWLTTATRKTVEKYIRTASHGCQGLEDLLAAKELSRAGILIAFRLHPDLEFATFRSKATESVMHPQLSLIAFDRTPPELGGLVFRHRFKFREDLNTREMIALVGVARRAAEYDPAADAA